MKIKIRVPATTANMGAGFDCLGAALSLYNTITIEPWHENKVIERGNRAIRFSENNMIYKSFKFLYEKTGKPCPFIKIYQNSAIPVSRGLGSSAACICAGLYGANALLDNKFSKEEILNFAAFLEGHPDNVAPAILGGFVVSLLKDNKVYYKRANIKKTLKFAAFVPDVHLKTENSREVLPKSYLKNDAVCNVASSSFFTASLISGNYDNLNLGVEDRFHQPYRLPLINNSEDIFYISYSLGAKAVYLSGAGSTIIALIGSDNKTFKARAIEKMINQKTDYFYLHILNGDNFGIRTEIIE